MKVNPIGIQSYQQVNRQDRPATASAEATAHQKTEQKVVIEPQAKLTKPALAVKGPSGDYSQYLSGEERIAIDQLFARFRDASRFDSNGECKTGGKEDENNLGRLVDIKV